LSKVRKPGDSEAEAGRLPGALNLTEQEDSSPFPVSWKWIYISVVIYTLFLILALYFMTAAFNR
jgi:hypothetical protein